ncbi:uncharacterized protein LOC127003377 [Eriocheir sinensis]|uniref:uncharacterized protein LOC127003377 n=1 Tax=Eriocheir sinensis TaxID=95602 RepID=UPI0021C851D9|nr:uncharacterized protein LOC127003377 [Eriocheir sinensis]XP_050725882.1 uncharacterized protein LOC127003377 [Eriocheir sinensis]XP_050725883.1 uncharacterized protein LOC127003377 [Eriocheir sinensis]
MACGRWQRVWVLAATLLVQGGASIRITRVKVPPTLEVGGAGELECVWEEERDHVYSLKWYQGAQEFYRYTPTATHPVQIFDPPTLDVDAEQSWEGNVRVANVSLAAEGPFHCEVSADAPTFHTASDSASMRVVDLPDAAPLIKGVRIQYLPSDWVDLTCTSGRSRPPAVLTFTLNGVPVSASWLEPPEQVKDKEGLTTSSLRLRFSLQSSLLRDGEGHVTCTAEIPGIYRQEAHSVLTTRPPYPASVLGSGPTTSVRPTAASTCFLMAVSSLLQSLLQRL